MGTITTKTRKVPKKYRNKRIYQGAATVNVGSGQGAGAGASGYTAGDGLSLSGGGEFAVVPDDVTIEINGSAQVAVKDVVFNKSGWDEYDGTAEDPGASSDWEEVAQLNVDNENISVGDHIRFTVGAICSGSTGGSKVGVSCRNQQAVGGTHDGIPDSLYPSIEMDGNMPNDTNMAVVEFNVWVLSTTKCTWSYKYIEVGWNGDTQREGGVVTLTNTTFGQDEIQLRLYILIRDTSGNDEIEFQFAYAEHIKSV